MPARPGIPCGDGAPIIPAAGIHDRGQMPRFQANVRDDGPARFRHQAKVHAPWSITRPHPSTIVVTICGDQI
jgi:hypothetical protein